MGIIDTLSAGFSLVRKRPWLMALPVVLDIGLWIAPRLSMVGIVRSMMADLTAAAGPAGPEALQTLQEQGRLLVELTEGANVAGLLVSSYLGVPSLPLGGATSFFGWSQQVIELHGGLGLVALVAALTLAGLFIGSFYLSLIAHVVRDGYVDWQHLWARLPRAWLRLIGAGLIITVALVSIGLPASLMIGLFGLFSPGLASLFMGVVFFLGFWLVIYMAFVPEAILLSEDGVMKAIWRSAMIVRSSFWPALGLFLLCNVISAGLAFIWVTLAATAPGALLAIVANAFIGTGLTAALYIFYRERLRAPRVAPEPQRS